MNLSGTIVSSDAHQAKKNSPLDPAWLPRLKSFYSFDRNYFGTGENSKTLRQWEDFTSQKCAKEVVKKTDPLAAFFSRQQVDEYKQCRKRENRLLERLDTEREVQDRLFQ